MRLFRKSAAPFLQNKHLKYYSAVFNPVQGKITFSRQNPVYFCREHANPNFCTALRSLALSGKNARSVRNFVLL